MRIGIIGPSRRRNGTGEFVTRYLKKAGIQIVAIAGKSESSAADAAKRLAPSDGHVPYPARSPADMFEACPMDAVAICSPAEHHLGHLRLALDAGVHVFCEKPFIWNNGARTLPETEALLSAFIAKRLVVHLNTQWVYTLSSFAALHGETKNARAFRMFLSPPRSGTEMLFESMPHAISMLVALGATGDVMNICAKWSSSYDRLDVRFDAIASDGHLIEAACKLMVSTEQPRLAAYEINHRRVERDIDMQTYSITLRTGAGKRYVAIEDPLDLSIVDFLTRVRASEYQGGANRILANVRMLDQLVTAVL